MGKNMSFETATKVIYGDDEYEVNGETYVDLEDKLESVDKIVGLSEGEKENAKEWIVYNALIDAGHFISRPSVPEPSLSKTFSEPVASSTVEDIPFYPRRDQIWTQEKILNEREKLIRKKEQEFNRRVKQLAVKQAKPKRRLYNFNHADGKDWTMGDWLIFSVTLIILLIIFSVPAFTIVFILLLFYFIARFVPNYLSQD